jgi:hypothetical protein
VFARLHAKEVANIHQQLATLMFSTAPDSPAPSLDLQPPKPHPPAQLATFLAEYPELTSWDELVAWYYAVAAVSRDFKNEDALRAPLAELRAAAEELLRGDSADDSTGISRYGSPRWFVAPQVMILPGDRPEGEGPPAEASAQLKTLQERRARLEQSIATVKAGLRSLLAVPHGS